MTDYRLYIDGEFCEASDGGRFGSVNPVNGQVWATAPAATEADVNRAVVAAQRALKASEWAFTKSARRTRSLMSSLLLF